MVDATVGLAHRAGVISFVKCNRSYNFVVHSLARVVDDCFDAMLSSPIQEVHEACWNSHFFRCPLFFIKTSLVVNLLVL